MRQQAAAKEGASKLAHSKANLPSIPVRRRLTPVYTHGDSDARARARIAWIPMLLWLELLVLLASIVVGARLGGIGLGRWAGSASSCSYSCSGYHPGTHPVRSWG